jgi:hypothetical protein
MNYELAIAPQNIKPHLDIENELQAKRTGLFTFTIRINSGNIVDLAIIENVDTRTYSQRIIIEKLTFAPSNCQRDEKNALRPNNL